MCWRHLSARGGRLSPLVPVAACTAARPDSCALVPPLDSGPPSVTSHLCLRLGSGGARQLCAGAALDSRRSSVASRLRRPLYSGAASSCALDSGPAGQLCACAAFDSRPPSAASHLIAVWAAAWRGSCALRGEGAVCRRRLRLEASVRRLSSHRRLDTSMMGRLCAGQRRGWQLRAGQQRARGGGRLCAGTTSRLEAAACRLSSPSPPVQRRGERLCAGQRRGHPAVRRRRLST